MSDEAQKLTSEVALSSTVWGRRRLLCVVAVSLFSIILALPAREQSSQTPAVCRNPKDGARGSPGARATLVLDVGEKTTLSFGRDRSVKPLHLDFTVIGCEFSEANIDKPLNAQYVTPIGENDRELKGAITVRGIVKARDKAVVSLFIDPNEAHPGTYVGAIVITDRRANQARVPVTVTLQYDRALYLLIPIIILAIAVGTLIVWWKGRLAGASDSYLDWWKKIGNIFAVGVGLLAARTAWGKAYLDDPDFGAELARDPVWQWPLTSNEWLGLATVVITAFLGAATVASLGGDKARGGVDAAGGKGRAV